MERQRKTKMQSGWTDKEIIKGKEKKQLERVRKNEIEQEREGDGQTRKETDKEKGEMESVERIGHGE